jgi:KEOPS complex subunit Cgi121
MDIIEGVTTVDDTDTFVQQLDEISERHGTVVQVFDARYVVDREHLRRAVELASRERERGNGIAREMGVEILLYAAGRRQIDRALGMGVSEGDCRVVAVVVGGNEDEAAESLRTMFDPAETLGDYDPERVSEFFDVSETELDETAGDLTDIVQERVAMLVVDR